ncbi:MAG TPA: cupin domain-containing protein [Chthoniobacterales bacterium]
MKTGKDDDIQLSAVEDHGGILTIRGGGPRRDWNGIHYKQGMSAKNVGTTKLSANIATIPPGGVAYAHIHVGFELILYIVEGKVRHEFGPGLKQVLENEAGDFIYIKPGVPHEVFNMSDTEPVVAFVARSSAEEWDNIIPYDRNRPPETEPHSHHFRESAVRFFNLARRRVFFGAARAGN